MFATTATDRDPMLPYEGAFLPLPETARDEWYDASPRALDLLRAAFPAGGWTSEQIARAVLVSEAEELLAWYEDQADDGRFGPAPILFVDGNSPGITYRGTHDSMEGLTSMGGCPYMVKVSPFNQAPYGSPEGLRWPIRNAPIFWATVNRED